MEDEEWPPKELYSVSAGTGPEGLSKDCPEVFGRDPLGFRARTLRECRSSWHFFSGAWVLPRDYFEKAAHDLRAERVEAFNLSCQAEAVAATDGLIAIYTPAGIAIYKWDALLQLTRMRTIRRSLLQFLANTGSLCWESVHALMQMLLFLIKTGVERCDLFLERAMLHLEIGDVLAMRIVDEELHCDHTALVTRVYDRRLRLLRTRLTRAAESAPMRIDCGPVRISVEDGAVVVDRGRAFVEKVRVGVVRQLVPTGHHLFVLADEGLKVLRFSE